MKTFSFIILFLVSISFTMAQEMKAPNANIKTYSNNNFRLDSSYAEIPNYAKKRDWNDDYSMQYKIKESPIYADIHKDEKPFIPHLLFNNLDQMPVLVPRYVDNMPVYIPDETVHFHMKILKIESIPTPNKQPLQ